MTETCEARSCSHHSSLGWLIPLICLAATGARAEDQCDGPVLKLILKVPSEQPPRTFYGVLAAFGGIPSFNLSRASLFQAAEPITACGQVQQGEPGSIYLVERGNCSFVDKYQAVVAAGGAGMVMFDDMPGCITMGGSLANSSNSSTSQVRNASLPPAISIDHSDGVILLQLLRSTAPGGISLQLQLLDVPALDISALLLWLMAVGTVTAGSLWSGWDYALELKGLSGGVEGGPAATRHSSQDGTMEVLEISTAGAFGFVAVSSAMLVLLYFFLNKVFFYAILVGFCAAGAQALMMMLVPVLLEVLPARLSCKHVSLPRNWGDVPAVDLVAGPVAVAVAVVWAVFRNAAWSWVLQDLLGIAVMLLVLRVLRLPNLKVACVLLPLCFCYDVWWVFLQPLVFGTDTSVMVEVAGGGDSHEFLPMLLRVPRLSGPPILKGAYSLLGFGDVILPGLLVALMRRLDISGRVTSWHAGYFVASVMGYGAGLLLTYVALMFSWFGDQGQPALLYLVPSTLGVVLVLAVVRGELWALMAGGAGDELQQRHEYNVVLGDSLDSEGDDHGGIESAGAQIEQQQQQQPTIGGAAGVVSAPLGKKVSGSSTARGNAALLHGDVLLGDSSSNSGGSKASSWRK